MKKRQVATIWIVGMLVWAVFFLAMIINSDDNVEFSMVVPIVMSMPFLLIGALLIYFSRGRKG